MLKLFGNLSRRDRLLAALSVLLIVAQVWLDLKLPDYTNEITRFLQMPNVEMSKVLTAGGKMLLCAFGSLLASVLTAFCVARIATNFGASLRYRLFDRVQAFSMQEIGGFSTSSLITRSTNDIMQVQMVLVMGLQVIVKAPITAAWAIVKISNQSRQWTFSTGVAIFILLCMVAVVMAAVMPKFKKLQKLTDEMNRVTRENLNGIRVVRAYNAEGYQEEKFAEANDRLTETHLYTQRVMATMMPTIGLVMNGLSLAINWIGAYLVQGAAIADKAALIANMVTFLSYAMQIVISFMLLVVVFIILPRASVSAKRIREVLDTEPKILDGTHTAGCSTGEVEFRNVTFAYPDSQEPAITDISFKVTQGQTLAFIGATGSGKSTVVNLIPRFYDVTAGKVLVDGRDVREYTLEALHSKLGYVSQKAVLFSGTVESNVDFGDNECADVCPALEIAQAADFVEKMPDGTNSYVAQGGTNLSGGQKQRISIARAIARKPEILIFDDSFSALDYRTDRVLREALKSQNSTKLIVAQRIGTIRDADCIVVMEEGAVAGVGTHDELMKTCETYRQIAYSQLSKEELQ